ncbi:MAG: CoA transferase [Dehalococcoidia bacterium]|nr:CoA transferase [Dehalococcoidia bacterium]
MTTAQTTQGPLAGIRVLDLSDELAVVGPRLLAALGADVVRPEPPGGDSLRRRYPVVTTADGQAESLAHLTHNTGKRAVIVPAGEAGFDAIRTLAEQADAVVLASTSPFAAAFQPSARQWADAHPSVTFVIADAYHADSPFAGGPFTDLTIAASSGFSWLCGLPGGTPEHPKGQMAYGYTGAATAVAVAAGIAARAYGNTPGWYELTAQEAFAFSSFQSADPNVYAWHGTIPSRVEWSETARRPLQQCRDGKWLTFVMLGTHWDAFADWLDLAGVSDQFHGEEWLDREYYLAHQHEFVDAIAELCRRNDRDDVVREGQARRLMVMPVSSITDLLADPQMAERQVFRQVATNLGPIQLPRAPVVYSHTPVDDPRPAPPLPSRECAVADTWVPRPVEPLSAGRGRLPLAGMRVADFSWMLAAPIATRVLADLGADVIRIESHARRDMTREIGPQPPDTFSLDTNSTQHHASSNKRSIALDLNHPEAIEVAREIVAKSDIVFENYTPGTMKRWGLEPEALMRGRPDLIVISQPAVGATGPHARWGAIGNGVSGYGGINMLTGFPQNPPFGVGPIVSDFIAPLFSVTALLAAVEHRRRTGLGQYVDCGMVEASLWILDTAWAETQLSGKDPERTGNRCAWMSPHGIFPAAGSDEWLALACRSDAEWRACADVLGLGALGSDARFATFDGRKHNEDALEQAIREATRARDRWELAGALLAAGVPAAPVEHIRDHIERDPGTRLRYSPVRHPYGHDFLVINQFIRPRGETVPNRRAPMIGEHSDEILRGLLGKSDDEIAALLVRGAIN